MARALIVGCGCRGRDLGARLQAEGWQARGTSRTAAGLEAIAAAGIDPALADPDRVGSILELVDDVAVVVWALGSAEGPPELIEGIHGPRLEHLLGRLVDTPVRGFVYEAFGPAPAKALTAGAELVRDAGERWRLPVAVIEQPPAGKSATWGTAMAAAVNRLMGLG